MITRIRQLISRLDSHTVEVLLKSTSSFFVKVLGILASLAISMYLGRELGADGLGIINLTAKIVNFIIVFVLFGVTHFLIKDLSISFSNNDFFNITRSIFSGVVFTGVFSIVIVFVLILLSSKVSDSIFNDPRIKLPLIIALFGMIPMVISRIFSSGLISFGKVWQSNLVNETLSAFVTLGFLMLIYFCDLELTLVSVAVSYAFSRLVVAISVGSIWFKVFTGLGGSLKSFKSKLDFSIIRKSMPFLLFSALGAMNSNVDSIMLGVFSDSSEVGLYTVAARIALMTSFVLQITNSSISSKLASMYSRGELDVMKKMVKNVTFFLMMFGFLSFLVFLIFGKNILSLWGNDFQDAYLVLLILSLGQFFNIATGATGYVLVMCGFEKVLSKIVSFSTGLNLLLNVFFIIYFGAVGAAISTAICVGIENMAKLFFVKKYTGISTIPFIN